MYIKTKLDDTRLVRGTQRFISVDHGCSKGLKRIHSFLPRQNASSKFGNTVKTNSFRFRRRKFVVKNAEKMSASIFLKRATKASDFVK